MNALNRKNELKKEEKEEKTSIPNGHQARKRCSLDDYQLNESKRVKMEEMETELSSTTTTMTTMTAMTAKSERKNGISALTKAEGSTETEKTDKKILKFSFSSRRDMYPANSSAALTSSTTSLTSSISSTKIGHSAKFKEYFIEFNADDEHSWTTLQSAVKAIQAQVQVETSREFLFRKVEDLCINGHRNEVVSRLTAAIRDHVTTFVPNYLNNVSNTDQFLKTVNRLWQQFCNELVMIRGIFLYLDRTQTLEGLQQTSVWEIGLNIFRDRVMEVCGTASRICNCVLEVISRERGGELVDRMLLKDLTSMLIDLQLYHRLLEQRIVEETAQHYDRESQEKLDALTVPGYLEYAEKRLLDESLRLEHYLASSTKKLLIPTCEMELMGRHMTRLLDKGLAEMLNASARADLERFYRLISRVANGLDTLRARFADYMKMVGRDIVINPEKDSSMVQELIDFKDKMDAVVNESFAKNEKFLETLRDSFEKFINQRANKPAEMIAKYVDGKLRAGNKEATDEELERLLDKVMVIFRFIHGKDVFEAFYKKDLAKRLLLGKSASVDAEKSMLSKLKHECGGQFTSKLEGMFKDMELSKDINVAFKQYMSEREAPGNIDLTVSVLTMGFWPSYPPVQVNLSGEMLTFQELFSNFYLHKHNGRKLQWQPNLGQCVVKARFTDGLKELQLSLYQTLVLLLFNDATELTLEEIVEKTKIEDGELRRTLQSLACGKARVLAKNPKSRDVEDDDTFGFNNEFKNKHYKIKINQVQMKETPEEQADTTERVFADRQYQIDAAIVRIMKMRKTLAHNLLLSEIYKQLKFPVKPADLKKRIESLIERDYMERDKNNPTTYHYVA